MKYILFVGIQYRLFSELTSSTNLRI